MNIASSNWGDVSGLFAGELPSLKQLNMKECKNLKTDSMETIGMKALGKFHHLSLGDEILIVWCYESIYMFGIPAGETSAVFLRASCLL